jgi:predicted DNA-binding transcriptional regulator AlpA
MVKPSKSGEQIPAGDFLSVPAICRLAGIQKVTFYQLVRQGKAPKPIRGVSRLAVEAWLQSRAATASAKAAAAQAAAASVRLEGQQ